MRRARAALLFAAATVASSLTVPGLGAPTNFWLLRQPGVVSADEDQLVDAFCRSLRAGDSTAAERALAALSARPAAVARPDARLQHAAGRVQGRAAAADLDRAPRDAQRHGHIPEEERARVRVERAQRHLVEAHLRFVWVCFSTPVEEWHHPGSI